MSRKLIRLITTIQILSARLTRSMLLLLAGTAVAIACGFSFVTDHSVRFNIYRKDRAFYRLPPLPIMYDKTTDREISVVEENNWLYEDGTQDIAQEKSVDERQTAWDQACAAIERGDLENAEQLLSRFLDLSDLRLFYDADEAERNKRRNSAFDMVDALSARTRGSKHEAVKAYLTARLAIDNGGTGLEFGTIQGDKNLRDNWDYLRAAALYKSEDKAGALAAFQQHAARFRRSEKNEAVMYMVAKLTMESSQSFGNLHCGIEGKTYYGHDLEAEKIEPPEKCLDENRTLALEAFRQVMKKYPGGRYFNDARGWIAYLHRRGSERPQALAEYYRLLGHPSDMNVRIEAKRSLQFMGHEQTDETLDEVERLIADDVNAALAYAYHRIYNHAIDYSYRESYTSSGQDWSERNEEETRIANLQQTGKHELKRVAHFATEMLKRYSASRVSSGFVLRVAEAQLELQNYAEALSISREALKMGITGDLRMQALWVKGSAEHSLKNYDAAETSFTQLLSEYPKSKLSEGARRLLAIIAEDRGDLESALEMYFELDYKTDVAYFLDVLLPVDRLAKFIESHKSHSEYNRMRYGLAVRYMREKRWDEARGILGSVQTEKGVDSYLELDRSSTWYFAKEPSYEDEKLTLIKASWVMQDLKTIDTLEHYEKAAQTAGGDEARAEALYQLASAYFELDDVAFYNPAAWGGGRVGALTHLQFTDYQRLSNESQIILEHMRAHDPLAHAIPIYEEIVDRFPETKAARDALYSAAVAHERLSDRNGTWGAAYARRLFPGPRIVTYADVKSTYPHYQLPRGTYGWKPSTRTVNGGPGWAAPPRPKPRETREQRVKRWLREFKGEVSTVATKLSSKLEVKADAGMKWYTERIEAAIYGLLAGAGLSVLTLIGIALHSRRFKEQLFPQRIEPDGAESRVDKMIG